MKRKIILIGGAPTAGKSTIAQMLSERLSLPWISTDQIRSMLRAVADKESYPELFNSSEYDAERFLTELSAEEIVEMEFKQGEETWLGVKAIIEHNYDWRLGFIVEGVGIIPNVVHKDFARSKEISAIFLVDNDKERMSNVIHSRGLWDDAHNYPDHLKPKEIEWASLYGEQIKGDAKKHGYPILEVSKTEDDVDSILQLLK